MAWAVAGPAIHKACSGFTRQVTTKAIPSQTPACDHVTEVGEVLELAIYAGPSRSPSTPGEKHTLKEMRTEAVAVCHTVT